MIFVVGKNLNSKTSQGNKAGTNDGFWKRLKEDVLKHYKIPKENSRSYDIAKDKSTGEHYLKPIKSLEKKLPKLKIPFWYGK